MIPDFDDRGYLPPGIHKATIDEIQKRFGWQSELRRVQMESLRWLLELIEGKDVKRFVINGSFTTDEVEPNDVDCILMIEDEVPLGESTMKEIRAGLPFLEVQVVAQELFDYLTTVFFSTDRDRLPKGLIEVIV
jgi:hypothetical protein